MCIRDSFQPVPAGRRAVHHRARRARGHVRGGRGRAGGAAGRAPRAVVGVERGGDVYGGCDGRRGWFLRRGWDRCYNAKRCVFYGIK